MAQVSACGSWENELRSLAQIDEPPYDVTQQSAQRGPLGNTWYNHLDFVDMLSYSVDICAHPLSSSLASMVILFT